MAGEQPKYTIKVGKRLRLLINPVTRAGVTTQFIHLQLSRTAPKAGAWAVLAVLALFGYGVDILLETAEFDALAEEASA